MQSAPYAVDVLEELMETATSEPVRLKASSEILDRAGVRGGMDIGLDIEVTDARSPAQIVMERLARLSEGAQRVNELLADTDITDAEVVEDEEISKSKEELEASGPDELPNNSTEGPAAAPASKFLPTDDGEDEDTAIQSDGFDEDELNV